MKANVKEQRRRRRKKHIRKNLHGTAQKPRVYLYRSNKYMYIGVTNDDTGEIIAHKKGEKNIKSAGVLGSELGKDLKKKKVEKVVFDRSGYKYHGRVKAVAEGLREVGIVV